MRYIFLSLLLVVSSFAFAYPPSGTMHDIAQDFQGTFTIIEKCCDDLQQSITDCCQTLEQDFAYTWTILDGINLDVNISGSIIAIISADITGVFTALEDLEETLTECCQEISQDFAFTWTILDEIRRNQFSLNPNANYFARYFSGAGTAYIANPSPQTHRILLLSASVANGVFEIDVSDGSLTGVTAPFGNNLAIGSTTANSILEFSTTISGGATFAKLLFLDDSGQSQLNLTGNFILWELPPGVVYRLVASGGSADTVIYWEEIPL